MPLIFIPNYLFATLDYSKRFFLKRAQKECTTSAKIAHKKALKDR